MTRCVQRCTTSHCRLCMYGRHSVPQVDREMTHHNGDSLGDHLRQTVIKLQSTPACHMLDVGASVAPVHSHPSDTMGLVRFQHSTQYVNIDLCCCDCVCMCSQGHAVQPASVPLLPAYYKCLQQPDAITASGRSCSQCLSAPVPSENAAGCLACIPAVGGSLAGSIWCSSCWQSRVRDPLQCQQCLLTIQDNQAHRCVQQYMY
jgi:hypothetical protein